MRVAEPAQPAHIRSGGGAEFVATAVQVWLALISVKCSASRQARHEDGYSESFDGRLRDELRDSEIFRRLAEANVLTKPWRQHNNAVSAHSSLGYRPPAPETASAPLASSGFDALHQQTTITREATVGELSI